MTGIIGLHEHLPIHEELTIIIHNSNTANVDLLSGLLLGPQKEIGNIDWISSELLLLNAYGRILMVNEMLKPDLWVGAYTLTLPRIPASLHSEKNSCVVTIKIIIVQVLHHQ